VGRQQLLHVLLGQLLPKRVVLVPQMCHCPPQVHIGLRFRFVAKRAHVTAGSIVPWLWYEGRREVDEPRVDGDWKAKSLSDSLAPPTGRNLLLRESRCAFLDPFLGGVEAKEMGG
jgi:hypothetical protein